MNENQAPQDDLDLAHFNDEFAASPVEERTFDEIPDGKYQVLIDKVELTAAKSSGNTMLKWTLRILGPRFAGRLLWRYHVISRDHLRWLKNDLHLCGLDLVKLSDLPDHLHTLLDIHLEISKRTKDRNVNVYFNRRLEKDDLDGGDSFGREGADHVPF